MMYYVEIHFSDGQVLVFEEIGICKVFYLIKRYSDISEQFLVAIE